MIDIIYIAYEFPPLNRGGTQRALKFVKYLRDFGINPHVLALDPKSYPAVYDRYHCDETTVGEIPQEIEVTHIPSQNIIRFYTGKLRSFFNIYFSTVDREAYGWRPYFQPAVDELVKRAKPKAILTTVPPFSIAPLGLEVAKKYALPFILDMRDEWTYWITAPYGSYFHYLARLKKERQCLSQADAIVCTSEQAMRDFQRIHPGIPPSRYHLVMNGYDEEIADWSMPSMKAANGRFKIGYVGNFYYEPRSREGLMQPWWRKKGHRMIQYVPRKEDWLYRSPYFFFRALRCLFDAHEEMARKAEVHFAGFKPRWIDEMVEKFDLERQVKFLGRISLRDSLEFQESCDALLITSSKVLNGEDYSIASKTFEYISRRKPILGFVTAGAQKRLLEKTGVSVLCDPDDPCASAEHMKNLIEGTYPLHPNGAFLESLHRKHMTRKLADVIKSVVK